jgi:hypothetical protein
METSLKTKVADKKEREKILELTYSEDSTVLKISLDKKELCWGDWNGNLKELFQKALEMWK